MNVLLDFFVHLKAIESNSEYDKKKNNQYAVRICLLISFYTKFNNFRNPKQNAKIVVFRCPLCRNTMFRQLDTTARLVSENSNVKS